MLNKQQKIEAVDAFLAGRSVDMIARMSGTSRGTIEDVLREGYRGLISVVASRIGRTIDAVAVQDERQEGTGLVSESCGPSARKVGTRVD